MKKSENKSNKQNKYQVKLTNMFKFVLKIIQSLWISDNIVLFIMREQNSPPLSTK